MDVGWRAYLPSNRTSKRCICKASITSSYFSKWYQTIQSFEGFLNNQMFFRSRRSTASGKRCSTIWNPVPLADPCIGVGVPTGYELWVPTHSGKQCKDPKLNRPSNYRTFVDFFHAESPKKLWTGIFFGSHFPQFCRSHFTFFSRILPQNDELAPWRSILFPFRCESHRKKRWFARFARSVWVSRWQKSDPKMQTNNRQKVKKVSDPQIWQACSTKFWKNDPQKVAFRDPEENIKLNVWSTENLQWFWATTSGPINILNHPKNQSYLLVESKWHKSKLQGPTNDLQLPTLWWTIVANLHHTNTIFHTHVNYLITTKIGFLKIVCKRTFGSGLPVPEK